MGQYDLEVTTFQLAVLFAWNQRPRERISFENLKLATELPDAELRRTLWVRTGWKQNTVSVSGIYGLKRLISAPPSSQSLVAFPKLKRQVLLYDPLVSSPKDFAEGTLFYVNQEFSLM